MTRRLPGQLRSPLRAGPVFGVPMSARVACSTNPLGVGITGLIGKSNVALDGSVPRWELYA
jgi:hypothetical protein